jgi:5-methyltetrahydrofolate--homocysteine methyltransferase
MKKSILEILKDRRVLFDGAVGTMLMDKGLPMGEPPEKWNLEHPEIVKQVHSAYFEAGSDVVQTNTFGGNRAKLSTKELDKDVRKINQVAAKLASEVAPKDKYVAGDIGPTGKFIKPLGDMTLDELAEVFAEQAAALAEGGADLISIETMYDLREAVAALKAAKKVTNLPVFAAITFNKGPNGFFTIMGNEVSTSMKVLEDEGADVVGSNCTLGSSDMLELAKLMRKGTNLPIIVQPNAGQPILKEGKTVYEQKPEDFAKDMRKMLELGCNVVGGCCGTNPAFIKAMSGVVKEFNNQNREVKV